MSIVKVPFDVHLLRVLKGDAITVRFNTAPNEHFVAVIDGGNDDDAGTLAEHLNSVYQTDTIDLMVCTHWHQDHICGLIKLVDDYKFRIKEVWVHDPEKYKKWARGNPEIGDPLVRGGIDTEMGFKGVDDGRTFLKKLDDSKIDHSEPFAGETANEFFEVIGPDREYYDKQMSKIEEDFRKAGIPFMAKAEKYDPDSIDKEKDDDCGYNNSGVILKMDTPNGVFLFAADAGREAISRALESSRTEKVYWLKVPHHGGKHNLSTELIKTMSPTYALISAQGLPKDVNHPCENIVGALRRSCGAKVYSTNSSGTISQFFSPESASDPGEEVWPEYV